MDDGRGHTVKRREDIAQLKTDMKRGIKVEDTVSVYVV